MNAGISALDFAGILRQSDELATAGSWDEAIKLLSDSNRREEHPDVEKRLMEVRHRAFADIAARATVPDWPKSLPDYFPGETSIPEIPASELTADIITSAIAHHGSLMVRGLLDQHVAQGIRDAIDHTFNSAAIVRRLRTQVPPWYLPFSLHREDQKFGAERSYARRGGGVLAIDAPRALFRHMEALSAVGFDRLLEDYFGERVALSAKKTTLRRTEPGALGGWHQDGSFLGTDIRSLNIWTALSPCGVDAPGLEIIPCRLNSLVKMGGPDIFDWAVSNETAARYGASYSIARPVFETGDALLFDEMTLHRTGVNDSMTKTRYAIEMWCFAASTYPQEQIPICW